MSGCAAAGSFSLGLNPEQFAAAFPFHFAVGHDFRILQIGPTLGRICPDLCVNQPLGAVMRNAASDDPLTPDGIRQNMSRFFLLEHPASGLKFRGQFIESENRYLIFLGSPWFTDTSELDAVGLRLQDFAVHDPVVDLLFVLQAGKTAVSDAKKLTARLTEQKEALQTANARLLAQQDELRRLALVAARTVNAVIITDEIGRVVWVNDGFVRVTGYTLEESRGRKPGDFLQGRDTDPETVQRIRTHLRQGEGFSETILNYHKNGTPYWVTFEVQPLHDPDGRLSNFMAIQTDVTERRRADLELTAAKEAAESANQAKSDFLATISHEIRTPLNGIIGLADIISTTPLQPEQREKLSLLIDSAQSLHTLINDLLDFSKIEAGRLEMENRVFALDEEIHAVVETLRPVAAAKGLRLETSYSDLPPRVRGDSLRVRQILSNLLSNAIKFTPTGAVRVESGSEKVGEKWRIHLSVTDTGIGIDPAARKHIFQPFTQADASVSRKFGGTGLGLAICRRLACMMDGDVSFETSADGTTFRVHLILGDGNDESTVRGDMASTREVCGLSVLVVDDNKVNRLIATTMLGQLVASVEEAASGPEALAMIGTGDFDAVFLDMRMPDMDGLEAAQRIRRQPLRKQPIIIALTANAYAADRERCLAAGMDGFLPKPIRLEGLRSELIRLVDLKANADSAPARAASPIGGAVQLHLPDAEAFLQFLGGDATLCGEVLRSAREDLRTQRRTIFDALEAGDLPAAANALHALRGGMGTLGATQAAEVMLGLEHLCETDARGSFSSGWNAFQESLDFYESELIRLEREIA